MRMEVGSGNEKQQNHSQNKFIQLWMFFKSLDLLLECVHVQPGFE